MHADNISEKKKTVCKKTIIFYCDSVNNKYKKMKTEGELCHANRQADTFPVSYSGIKITTSKVKVFARLARPHWG